MMDDDFGFENTQNEQTVNEILAGELGHFVVFGADGLGDVVGQAVDEVVVAGGFGFGGEVEVYLNRQ